MPPEGDRVDLRRDSSVAMLPSCWNHPCASSRQGVAITTMLSFSRALMGNATAFGRSVAIRIQPQCRRQSSRLSDVQRWKPLGSQDGLQGVGLFSARALGPSEPASPGHSLTTAARSGVTTLGRCRAIVRLTPSCATSARARFVATVREVALRSSWSSRSLRSVRTFPRLPPRRSIAEGDWSRGVEDSPFGGYTRQSLHCQAATLSEG
jgi:hypothetical protein